MKKNLIYTAISIGSRLVTGLLLFVLLARLWGPTNFGLFSFIFSASTLLSLIVDFGFSGYILRELGANPSAAAPLMRDAFFAKATLTIPFLAASGATMLILGMKTTPFTVAFPLLLSALLFSFADFFTSPLRALGRYDLETITVTTSNVFHFILTSFIAWHFGTITAVAWAFFFARLFYVIAATRVFYHVVPEMALLTARGKHPAKTLAEVWSYGIDGILTSTWSQVDVIIVRAIYGTELVGVYVAGQKIVQGVSTLGPVVGNVMIPRLSRLAKTHDEQFYVTSAKTSVLMLAIGLAFSAPLIALPDQVSRLLFGHKYESLGPLLPLFGIILIVKFLAAAAGVVITAAGLQKKRIAFQIAGISVFSLLSAVASIGSFDIDTFLVFYAISILVIATLGTKQWILLRTKQGNKIAP